MKTLIGAPSPVPHSSPGHVESIPEKRADIRQNSTAATGRSQRSLIRTVPTPLIASAIPGDVALAISGLEKGLGEILSFKPAFVMRCSEEIR